jgi:very-short-patch-repair endonuclease
MGLQGVLCYGSYDYKYQPNMPKIKPTKEALLLNKALNDLDIETELEHWDGHKHVDIFVPAGNLYIEIDGIRHYTNVTQISSDFRRDHYSEEEGFKTFRIPSILIQTKVIEIANAIKNILTNSNFIE